MPDEWFVIAPDADGEPKYLDTESGIAGFSGARMTFDEPQFSQLPWAPDPMWVCRVYGTSAALTGLGDYGDTYGQSGYGLSTGDIARYFNARVGRSRPFAEWALRFHVTAGSNSDGGGA